MNQTAVIHPLAIGDVVLKNNLILAPMAGVCDLPFRLLCSEMRAGLVCMEMVSAKAIHYKNRNTQELMRTQPQERPVSLQLFGSEPELLGEIAAQIADHPFDILDFNMGCPVPKVVKNGEGSALMQNPALAERILRAMVRASAKPVTVKIRAGFDDAHMNAVEIAQIAEDCGIAAVVVHGRTRQQFYTGSADWEIIRRVKDAVRIPVIGNGDLQNAQDVARMYEQTGCDGYMIGRASRGNPWIFDRILRELETGQPVPPPEPSEIMAMILRHARLLIACKGEYIGMREMRKHTAWYTTGLRGASRIRGLVNEVETYAQLEELLKEQFLTP